MEGVVYASTSHVFSQRDMGYVAKLYIVSTPGALRRAGFFSQWGHVYQHFIPGALQGPPRR